MFLSGLAGQERTLSPKQIRMINSLVALINWPISTWIPDNGERELCRWSTQRPL